MTTQSSNSSSQPAAQAGSSSQTPQPAATGVPAAPTSNAISGTGHIYHHADQSAQANGEQPAYLVQHPGAGNTQPLPEDFPVAPESAALAGMVAPPPDPSDAPEPPENPYAGVTTEMTKNMVSRTLKQAAPTAPKAPDPIPTPPPPSYSQGLTPGLDPWSSTGRTKSVGPTGGVGRFADAMGIENPSLRGALSVAGNILGASLGGNKMDPHGYMRYKASPFAQQVATNNAFLRNVAGDQQDPVMRMLAGAVGRIFGGNQPMTDAAMQEMNTLGGQVPEGMYP